MAKGKKKKDNNVKTFSLGEFLEIDGNGEIPIYKEIDDGKNKIMINLSDVPSAPLSSFEIIIKPYILKSGSPYHLVAKNIPFDCTQDQIRSFFACEALTVEIQHDDANRSKGIAVVAFKNLEEYTTALEKDGLKIGTRSIHLTQGKLITEFDDRNNQKSDKKKFGENHNQERQDEMDACSDWRANKKNITEHDRERRSESISAAQTDDNWRSAKNSGDGNPGRTGLGKDNIISAAQTDDNWRSKMHTGEGNPGRIGSGKDVNISAAQSDNNWRSNINAGAKNSGRIGSEKKDNISAAQSDDNWRLNPRPPREHSGLHSMTKKYFDKSEAMSDSNWKSGTKTSDIGSSATGNTSKPGAFFDNRNKNKSANSWNTDQKKNVLSGNKDPNYNCDLSILRNPNKKIQTLNDDSSSTQPTHITRK